MRPLDMDFAPGRFRAGPAFLAALLAALALAGVLVRHQEMEGKLADLEARAQRSQRLERDRSGASRADLERLGDEIRQAGQVVERLGLPWGTLFRQIDGIETERVALLSVEPDTERREVRLTAEAKDAPALVDYLRQVRALPVLRDAHVSTHQVNAQDPQKPIRFTVSARWRLDRVDAGATAGSEAR